MPTRNQPAQSFQIIANSNCRKNKKRCRSATAKDRPEATVPTPNIAPSQTLAYDTRKLFELRRTSWSAWMNVKLIIIMCAVVALLTSGSQASAQLRNQTIQLPVIRQFNVRTSVSVPDGGTIGLGGVVRSSNGRVLRGLRPFSNQAGGRSTSSGHASVRAWVLPQDEIDAAILAGATLPKESKVPYYKQVWDKQARNQRQQIVQPKPLEPVPVANDGIQLGNAEPEGIFLGLP